MSRNFELLMQVIVNGFTPLLLLTPLAVVLLSKFNPPDEAARTQAQKLFKLLCLFTSLSLLLWAGLFFFGPMANPTLSWATWIWPLVFPLMHRLAMPTLVARNPELSQKLSGAAPSNPVRSASLVNRQHRSPLKRWHWVIAIGVYLLPLIAIGARGLFPFEMPQTGVAQTSGANPLWTNWITMLLTYAGIGGSMLLMAPRMIRMSLVEPAHGWLARGNRRCLWWYRWLCSWYHRIDQAISSPTIKDGARIEILKLQQESFVKHPGRALRSALGYLMLPRWGKSVQP